MLGRGQRGNAKNHQGLIRQRIKRAVSLHSRLESGGGRTRQERGEWRRPEERQIVARTVLGASRLRSDVLKENSSEEDMFPFNTRTVTEPRILLVGQTGAGKSSFFNSLNSIFRDHVTMQALCGYGDINVSKKFRTYSVSLGAGGRKLPYILCDTMGLERSGFEEGIKVEDIISVIKGHVSDMYEFNPRAAINCHDPHYIRSPSVKDKMHCVVFVVDANKIVNLPKFQLLKKFKEIKSEVNSLGIPLLVLVTKIDKACMEVQKDLTKVYSSRYLHEKVTQLGQMLGVPVSSISLVKNYATETELNFSMDLLILKALQQMLRAIDVYFEETNVRRTTLW
ncbi:IF44L protein, partial [Polypterus senegalus]